MEHTASDTTADNTADTTAETTTDTTADSTADIVGSDDGALKPIESADGQTRYIDPTESERGSLAPFDVVYAGIDREERWGYYCRACGSVDNAVDTMGRIVCNRCGNMRKAEEWDAAHE